MRDRVDGGKGTLSKSVIAHGCFKTRGRTRWPWVAEKGKLAFASNPSRLLLSPPHEEALPLLFLFLVTASCTQLQLCAGLVSPPMVGVEVEGLSATSSPAQKPQGTGTS